uniref:2-C-methyl-D-erythritol 2,4-cyclodiphosphate synthase n=1 Tax=Candidatus Kentrum sp. SD TaxID=2126332 RepID=A0A450YDA7_9GAMM|nr:MAG: 2-C-methyl-D-erythritol 2,4-cyclodiphosphate synthase [Candidatus Kentron sp. SD]VFK44696.1 MAG: 2-C-methyl-D-erythritol 2,4-cyclodiphosphate synthase [Candidatus Kentron sp. SD]VFK79429.1 MAG: 2-C-methyl-D-erythritol 2,4-cyclodiphosphate synthase [Candidatus Kentron sp. SD]
MRIGHGYDAHRFTTGRPLILGGVTIPFDRGLLAHSDGDVLIHALCDALLGAAGLDDIGVYFPDSDPRFKDIDSRTLLRTVVEDLRQLLLIVSSVDLTLIAEAPKLRPFIPDMHANLLSDLHHMADPSHLNIKATTTEGMGFTGRGEGIAAHAVVLLEQRPITWRMFLNMRASRSS